MGKRILALFLILSVNCSGEEKINVERIISLNPDNTTEVSLNEFAVNVEFLNLSSDNETYIGDITNIQITDDRIYTLDTFGARGLYIFDREGIPLHIINDYGKGPGEFIGPSAFAIDDSNNQIILYDAGNNKLLFYNKEDYEFLFEEILSFFPETFTVTENNFLFYLNNIPNEYDSNFIITNKDLKVVGTELPIKETMLGYHFFYPFNFSSSDERVYFFAPSDYYIYTTDRDHVSFREYINVDFGDRSLPNSFYKEQANNQSRLAEIGESAYNISNYFETDSFIFFVYKSGKRSFHYYIESKKSGRIIHTEHSKLLGLEMTGPIPWWPIGALNNKLIWHQHPMVLRSFINSKKNEYTEGEWENFNVRNNELMEFSQTITDEENPYLIIMEIDF